MCVCICMRVGVLLVKLLNETHHNLSMNNLSMKEERKEEEVDRHTASTYVPAHRSSKWTAES